MELHFCHGNCDTACKQGFTLIELLTVIVIIVILAALLFPAITSAKAKGDETKCLANLRQWGMGLNLYLVDHEGIFPEEAIGKATPIASYTGAWFNVLAPYMGMEPLSSACAAFRPPRPRDKSVFMCPSLKAQDVVDESGNPISYGDADPVFAYAYNLWLDHDGRASEHGGTTAFGARLRMSQLLKPSKSAVFGEVAHAFFDNMASYHLRYRHGGNNRVNIVLADGHVRGFSRTEVFVSRSQANAKKQNKGVIWDPEGILPQTDPSW